LSSNGLIPQKGPTGYFNNVVLADHIMGELRRAMESSGQWDRTWVFVSADHSWRLSASYDGKRDFRVPFIVKPPGPNASMIDAQEFNTAVTAHVINAIIDRQITNAASGNMYLGGGNWTLPTRSVLANFGTINNLAGRLNIANGAAPFDGGTVFGTGSILDPDSGLVTGIDGRVAINPSAVLSPGTQPSNSIGTITIPADLGGLPIRYTATALAPLPQLAAWIERVALAKRAATQ